ncbi:MAG: 30S ribosomal protein S2 [Candidatus Absconditabacteria bacterium]|nr:30S ribosomal protein S2 [Candidatus Absconditabacteria bacterium]
MSIATKDVVDAQLHIGTLKSEAHPKTSKFWADVVNGVVVISPDAIITQLEAAKEKIQKAKEQGKEILVVSEKKMYAEELEALGAKLGFNYLNYKVPGGFLTNFDTLKKRIESMNTMEKFLETDAYNSLTKKEQLVYKRKLARVFKIYKGVKNLSKKPDLVVVLDGLMMENFVNEIEKKKEVDSILICGTNFPRWWKEDGLIIANINSHKSTDFILKSILS